MVHHKIGDVLESDGALVQFPAMLRRDPVDHSRGVESAYYVARPFLALQEPARENGKALMRIDEAPILRHGSDAVRVSVGCEPGVTLLLRDRRAQQLDVRLDRLGVNARKKRIHLLS